MISCGGMYKVIIADDEAAVRERVASFLKRRNEEFELVGSFENGYDAMVSGLSLEPDLLITDIKMPFINGLELIKQARQELPMLQAIIISGFDNFDYAKQAIDLGVIGYISKPVTFGDISDSLDKAKVELDKKLVVDTDIKDLQKKEETVLKAVQENDLNKLVTLKTAPKNFSAKLKADGIAIDKRYATLASFDLDKDEESLSYEESELVNYYLDKYVDEEFGGYTYFSFENSMAKNVIFVSDAPFDKEELQIKLSRIITHIKKTCGSSISAGVSETGDRENDISYRKLFRHAKWTLEYRTVIGTNIVLFYTDLENKSTVIGKVDENEFKNISYDILYGRDSSAKEAVGKMIDTISSIDYKDSYFLIINNLLDSILKSCIAIDKLYSSYIPHVAMVNRVYGSKQSDTTKGFFYGLVDRIIAINDAQRISGVDEAYQHIQHFLESNFCQSGLSMDAVAEELGYSVSYVSAILKRHDTSFTKYLTQIRMEKAKALLADPNNKIASIASEIGYEDPYYFSHCFKKYYGVSPMEHRKS